ncbi:hypothetical protein D9M68_734390 [compost metagenome]
MRVTACDDAIVRERDADEGIVEDGSVFHRQFAVIKTETDHIRMVLPHVLSFASWLEVAAEFFIGRICRRALPKPIPVAPLCLWRASPMFRKVVAWQAWGYLPV